MIKRLAGCIREYKTPTIITLILIVLEAVIETAIPFITADLVNRIKAQVGIEEVVKTGIVLALMALVSL